MKLKINVIFANQHFINRYVNHVNKYQLLHKKNLILNKNAEINNVRIQHT